MVLILKADTIIARSHLIKYFLIPNVVSQIDSLFKSLIFYTEALPLTQGSVLCFHVAVLATADPSSNWVTLEQRTNKALNYM